MRTVVLESLQTQCEPSPAAVYLAGLAPASRSTLRAALNTIAGIVTGGRCDAATIDWPSLRYTHTAALRSVLATKYAPSTANKHLTALRGVLHEARRLGIMSSDDHARAIDLQPVRGETLPRGRALPPTEVRALFAACAADSSAAGRRDAAVLAVLYGGGLRRAEAAALQLADYDAVSGALIVRLGKGHKARVVYLTPQGGRVAIDAWRAVRGEAAGPLFCPVNHAGRFWLSGISGQAVYGVLRKRATQAGIARCSPHDLRRTFISDLLDAGADLATVQRLAGHAAPGTTVRYDRRGEAAKRAAAELLVVPYRAPNAKARATRGAGRAK